MKTIGLLGGMSWESTVSYYTRINQGINQALGGLHSAKILLASVEFQEIEAYQQTNQWEKSGEVLAGYAKALENGGADFLLICTNTMHKVAPQIQEQLTIPILHIADATIEVLKQQGIQTIGLLGTQYTMTQDFYKQRIVEQDIEVLIPDEAAIERINDIIFNELCLGELKAESKAFFLEVVDQLASNGAQGVILGCTEIGLLIQQADTDLPLFDTTEIHSEGAVRMALED
ncbi:racemase [Enterococcus florum]|uniref:Racemase n=1 Tax=Enterococcus florum TaxID=2480627 RepID=A0A4P5P787_9ENTE|nr:aspartate/glutamate racemase family protein [Enterococcus florum]GCF93835.1 racemase [Enterococcus florum]